MPDLNSVYISILNELVSHGNTVKAERSLSIGSEREYLEILNYQFTIETPQFRLINPNFKIFNIYTAIGRFLWLMRGSNSLEEIRYYDEKVKNFSDDGITIPGSSFGNRIFKSNNINQFDAVVQLLKEDRSTRRAAISVFQPHDVQRNSKDIPCLFGFFFHIRGEKLLTSIILRSNNALSLLPYNFFELSLVSEVMAIQLGIPPGPITYHAVSMHLYSDDMPSYNRIVTAAANNNTLVDMPFGSHSSQLESLEILQQLEKELRTTNTILDTKNLNIEINEKLRSLPEKWFQFYLILLDYHLIKNKKNYLRIDIKPYISHIYKSYLWD